MDPVKLTSNSHKMHAHSHLVSRLVCGVVAVQPFVWVAEVSFVTDVSRLLGADSAASTAIPHQAHPRRTAGLLRRASAGPVTDLFPVIHFRCISRPFSSRGRVWWHTAPRPAAELHLVIKVTLEIPEPILRSLGDTRPPGRLRSDELQFQYLTLPLPDFTQFPKHHTSPFLLRAGPLGLRCGFVFIFPMSALKTSPFPLFPNQLTLLNSPKVPS